MRAFGCGPSGRGVGTLATGRIAPSEKTSKTQKLLLSLGFSQPGTALIFRGLPFAISLPAVGPPSLTGSALCRRFGRRFFVINRETEEGSWRSSGTGRNRLVLQ